MAAFTTGNLGVNKLRESAGPTTLTIGAVADGEFLVRSGTGVIGSAGSGGIPDQVHNAADNSRVDTEPDTNNPTGATEEAYGANSMVIQAPGNLYKTVQQEYITASRGVRKCTNHFGPETTIATTATQDFASLFDLVAHQGLGEHPDNTTAARNTTWQDTVFAGSAHILVKVAGSTTAYATRVDWACVTGAQVHPTQLEIVPGSVTFSTYDYGANPAGIYTVGTTVPVGNTQLDLQVTNDTAGNIAVSFHRNVQRLGAQLA